MILNIFLTDCYIIFSSFCFIIFYLFLTKISFFTIFSSYYLFLTKIKFYVLVIYHYFKFVFISCVQYLLKKPVFYVHVYLSTYEITQLRHTLISATNSVSETFTIFSTLIHVFNINKICIQYCLPRRSSAELNHFLGY